MTRAHWQVGLLIAAMAVAGARWEIAAEEPTSLVMRADAGRLERITRAVRDLRAAAQPQPRSGELLDVRTVFHVHSHLSHDSRGKPEEILAAARKLGIQAVFMTEHSTPDRRHLRDQWRGLREGVLFVAGTELSEGLLLFRADDVEWQNQTARTLLERLQGTDSIALICHPEQRTDWDLPAFAGMEIYNTHADMEEHREELSQLTSNLANAPRLYGLLKAFERFPAAGFAAIFDPPRLNLRLWDRFNQQRRVVGIAGNDAHQNTGLVVQVAERTIQVRDRAGAVLAEVNRNQIPPALFGRVVWRTGDELINQLLDPYEISLGYVTTHLLAPEVSEAALFEALLAGRAYVAFDWIADPSGFTFTASDGETTALMGGEVRATPTTRLHGFASLACEWRIVRNGQVLGKDTGRRLSFAASEPGTYRVEAWLTVAGEPTPWIYSNPIYVR